MNGNPVAPSELQNLIAQINKASSFVEKIYIALCWSGNNIQRISITGVSWKNESSFFINFEKLAPLFNVKPDTIRSSLRNNFFIKQYNPESNGPRFVWSKPGLSVHGFESKDQNANSSEPTIKKTFDAEASTVNNTLLGIKSKNAVTQIKLPLKTGNNEFDNITNLIFTNSDCLKRSEIIEIFYQKLCPNYIEKFAVKNVFCDYFNIKNFRNNKDVDLNNGMNDDLYIDRDEFWLFYQHFGPLNSILAKYNLYKNFSIQNNQDGNGKSQIVLGEKNKFLVKNKFLIFNDYTINAGKLFLKSENGYFCDSWEKVEQIDSDNWNSSPFPPTNFNIYPISP